MTGMEDVLAGHALDSFMALGDELDWDDNTHWKAECDCGWEQIVDDHRPGEIAHAAHVAEALTAAGFGNLHDAWAEGVATALNHAIQNDDGITLRLEHLDGRPWTNPYPKVSET